MGTYKKARRKTLVLLKPNLKSSTARWIVDRVRASTDRNAVRILSRCHSKAILVRRAGKFVMRIRKFGKRKRRNRNGNTQMTEIDGIDLKKINRALGVDRILGITD